ncbi:DUF4838 domain-containing protein [Akkermansia glycaniphila]|uniref:DUF4838 domain-containing protein n=1 Tax=Akkermansia glycaniphila TaxID=1679444 RepID=UPI001C02578A|nr:DUF4838 domain-containing protein [Akkermansia glycaniphila]MBT9450480.1 DUF4838 domain-containing protein [Akkermansia glycaniphila]
MKPYITSYAATLISSCLTVMGTLSAAHSQESPPQPPLQLAAGGTTEYTILTPDKPSGITHSAADELAFHLKQITGAEWPVKQEQARADRPEIRLEITDSDPAVPQNTQGYRIFTEGNDIIIRSRSPHGLLYGTYALLEDKYGCRWYTPDETLIPRQETLRLDPFDTSAAPAFVYRDIYAADVFRDRKWAQRLRLNSGTFRWPDKPTDHLYNYMPGYSCHTFEHLVPPDKHFKTHPEYYGLVNGKRDKNLLCLSNPAVFETALATLRTDLARHKERPCIVSISQNDCGGWCQCPECTRIIAEEGDGTGLLMRFLNKFDDALQGENVTVHTLAYHTTDIPPTKTKPNPGIIIQLCPIGICYGHYPEKCSHSGSEGNIAFERKIKGWSAIHDNLWIWSYHINFAHSFQPFPNIHTLPAYIRYFADHKAKGVFAQSDAGQRATSLKRLKHYLLAKLLWNPQADANALTREFLEHYYKEAAAPMAEYLAALAATIENTPNLHTWIYDAPHSRYLSNDFIEQSENIFAKALEAAKNNPVTLNRVKIEQLSIQYLILTHWLRGNLNRSNEEILKIVDEFETVCRENNITGLSEHDWKDEQRLQFIRDIRTKAGAQPGN